ncbi:hypothetical protein HMN09_00077500 [Mycena chlorophos]|uniref:Uncharacterized protein n=1 Tax=Mycena chlorophos TaxID=658473 RepID=A0A8H6TPW3_MYCCL|nr:hypothetical protein HMN09_00077500 [Mycena chlorophos]
MDRVIRNWLSVDQLEHERDSLRDVVAQLVEQDLSLAHPRLVQPQLLDPLVESTTGAVPSLTNTHLWTYAAATIVSLRAALLAEQNAHAETRRHLILLEAQLAHCKADMAAAGMLETLGLPHEIAQTEAEIAQLVSSINRRKTAIAEPPPPTSPISSAALYDVFMNEVAALTRQMEDVRLGGHHIPARPVPPPPIEANAPHPKETTMVLEDLEREIAGLGSQVDALREERSQLWQQVRDAHAEDQVPLTPPRVCCLLCLSTLLNQLKEPPARFYRPPTPGPSHNAELLSPEPSSPPLRPEDEGDLTERPADGQSLLDWDGEQSMELATPLVPSLILSTPVPLNDDEPDPNVTITEQRGTSPRTYPLLPTAGPSPDLEVGLLGS